MKPNPHLVFGLVFGALAFTIVVAPVAQHHSSPLAEADTTYVKTNYTKSEHMIPMRDGVKLFTAIYAPKDQSVSYPILLQRTPYSVRPYGVHHYADPPEHRMRYYAREGFIFVYQDVRGRYGSKGEFVHVRPYRERKGPWEVDESTDTWDTIDWLVKHVPDHNGKVGLTGTSYPGFYATMGIIDAHPALEAASPQAPVADWFVGDDFHHNGAFYLAHAFRFFSRVGQQLEQPTRQQLIPFDYGTSDGYEFYLNVGPLANIDRNHFKGRIAFWQELMEHGVYDEFWKARNILPHLKNITPAVMTVGGWFDAEDLYGPLNIYQSVEQGSPGVSNTIVMGPWAHGGWHSSDGEGLGHVSFNQKTARYFRTQIELPFFLHHLKDAEDPRLPEALMFETGSNQWRRYDAWPPSGTEPRTLYLRADGQLRFEPPAGGGAEAFDEYVSDPAKPVPFIPNIAIGMTREHMLDDQRFAASRPDVLVYATAPLEADVTIAGPIQPTLYVSTTGTDADWVVKLIDVYHGDFPNPDPNPAGVELGGYQQLVRGEAIRGKFRNGFEVPEPFESRALTKVAYVMPDAYHTFRRGHRIMVQIQSTWFPLVDRNPQTFVDIYAADAADFQKATHRVYRSAAAPSQVTLQVLAR